MGFFDKVKGFFNVDGAKIEINEVETPFAFTDTAHRGRFLVKAGGTVATVKDFTVSFVAILTKEDGQEVEVLLSEEEVGSAANWSDPADNPIPKTVDKNTTYEIQFLLIRVDLLAALREYGITNAATARNYKTKFKIKVEVDIAEAVGLFDPTAEREIEVIDK